jgi:hypothetical protein
MTAVLKDDAELYKQFSDNPEFRRTIEGAVPMPSAFSITFGVLPSMTATHELVDADNFVMEHTPRGRRRAPPASEKPCDARLGRHQQGAVAGTRQLSLGPPRGLPYQKSPNPSDVRARCLRNGISKTSAACHLLRRCIGDRVRRRRTTCLLSRSALLRARVAEPSAPSYPRSYLRFMWVWWRMITNKRGQ